MNHPTGTWPAVAARLAGADLISLKLGINLVNMDLMRLRAFGPAFGAGKPFG